MTEVDPNSAIVIHTIDDRKTTRRIVVGAAASTLGIALSVFGLSGLGSWLTLGGLGLLMWSLHRFGRSGPR